MQPEQECWVLVGMQSERDFGDVRAVVAAVAVAAIAIRGIMFMKKTISLCNNGMQYEPYHTILEH